MLIPPTEHNMFPCLRNQQNREKPDLVLGTPTATDTAGHFSSPFVVDSVYIITVQGYEYVPGLPTGPTIVCAGPSQHSSFGSAATSDDTQAWDCMAGASVPEEPETTVVQDPAQPAAAAPSDVDEGENWPVESFTESNSEAGTSFKLLDIWNSIFGYIH